MPVTEFFKASQNVHYYIDHYIDHYLIVLFMWNMGNSVIVMLRTDKSCLLFSVCCSCATPVIVLYCKDP